MKLVSRGHFNSSVIQQIECSKIKTAKIFKKMNYLYTSWQCVFEMQGNALHCICCGIEMYHHISSGDLNCRIWWHKIMNELISLLAERKENAHSLTHTHGAEKRTWTENDVEKGMWFSLQQIVNGRENVVAVQRRRKNGEKMHFSYRDRKKNFTLVWKDWKRNSAHFWKSSSASTDVQQRYGSIMHVKYAYSLTERERVLHRERKSETIFQSVY